MTVPQFIYALRWLVRDTFRQALSSGIVWLMLTVTVVCVLLCLSMSVEGGKTAGTRDAPYEWVLPAHDPEAKKIQRYPTDVEVYPEGVLSIGFGAFRIKFNRFDREIIRFVQLLLAGGVADTFGVLLTLIWTAGFLPTFLDPSVSSVLLSKPLPRWGLLVGKYIGV